MIGVSKFALKLSSSRKNTSWRNPKPNNNVRDLEDMSDAILETSIVEMRSDRRLRLTRGGGRSLVAKLPPPKNRNKREDILTILTCGASPAEGRRGATRDSSIRGRPNLVSCDGTAPFLRHHSYSSKHGKGRNHCQVIKESSACVWATQILSVKANSSKNSNELLPILLGDSRPLDLPIIPAAGSATKRRGPRPPLRLSARMN